MSGIYTPDGGTIASVDYVANQEIGGSDTSYLLPRQVGTGSTRGTQTVGYGNVLIDGSNDRIVLGDSSSNGSTITLGQQSMSTSQPGVASSSISSSAAGFGINITEGNDSITLGTTTSGIGMSINNASNKTSLTLGTSSTNGLQMLFNDGTTNRLLVGQNAGGREVVWISPTGVEVTTASAEQLIFNSDQDIFKIVKTDIVSLSGAGPGTTNTVTVTLPNYGGVPAFLAFLQSGVNYGTPLPSFNLVGLTTGGGVGAISTIVSAASFQVGNDGTIEFSTTNFQTIVSDPNIYNIKYYVLQETAQ